MNTTESIPIEELSIHQIKVELSSNGVSYVHCVEKKELQDLLRETRKKKQNGENTNTSTSSTSTKPKKEDRKITSGTGIDGRKIVDMYYYELLDVTGDADGSKIKKAYYRLAKRYHPDKNPGDKECEEMFKKISDAYQVLSDEKLRVDYDKYGPDKLSQDTQFADPREFFGQLFGGGKFDEFFGELNQAMSMSEEEEQRLTKLREDWVNGGYQGPDPVQEYQRKIFDEEVKKLSEILAKRIEPYVKEEMTIDQIKLDATTQAKELLNENLGPDLLNSVGFIYATEAQRLRGGLRGVAANLSGLKHEIGSKWSMVKGLVDVSSQQRAAEELQEHQERDEINLTNDEMQEIQEGMMQSAFSFIWKLGRVEAEGKLRRVVITVVQAPVEPPADLPPPVPPKKEPKRGLFGSLAASVSKSFAKPTPEEEHRAAVLNRRVDAVEAIGAVFLELAKPGVEKRKAEERAARAAAREKLNKLRQEGRKVRAERQADENKRIAAGEAPTNATSSSSSSGAAANGSVPASSTPPASASSTATPVPPNTTPTSAPPPSYTTATGAAPTPSYGGAPATAPTPQYN